MEQFHQQPVSSAPPGAADGHGTSPGQVRQNLQALGRALNQRRRLRLSVRGVWLGLLVVVGGLALRLAGYALAWPFFVFPGAFVSVVALIYAWS